MKRWHTFVVTILHHGIQAKVFKLTRQMVMVLAIAKATCTSWDDAKLGMMLWTAKTCRSTEISHQFYPSYNHHCFPNGGGEFGGEEIMEGLQPTVGRFQR